MLEADNGVPARRGAYFVQERARLGYRPEEFAEDT